MCLQHTSVAIPSQPYFRYLWKKGEATHLRRPPSGSILEYTWQPLGIWRDFPHSWEKLQDVAHHKAAEKIQSATTIAPTDQWENSGGYVLQIGTSGAKVGAGSGQQKAVSSTSQWVVLAPPQMMTAVGQFPSSTMLPGRGAGDLESTAENDVLQEGSYQKHPDAGKDERVKNYPCNWSPCGRGSGLTPLRCLAGGVFKF